MLYYNYRIILFIVDLHNAQIQAHLKVTSRQTQAQGLQTPETQKTNN